MKAQTQQNPETIDLKFNKIEKIFINQESTNIYSTSSENALYILTDKNKFLIFEKNSTNKNYLQINLDQYIQKDKTKLQTLEKENRIWSDEIGNHVLIKYK